MARWPALLRELTAEVKAGKLKWDETIVEGGIAAVADTFISIFAGANTGKLLVKF